MVDRDIKSPEKLIFNVISNEVNGTLQVEPFDHRAREWGSPYSVDDPIYLNLVESRPGVGDMLAVSALDLEGGEVWGYNSPRRVRVLIDSSVSIELIEEF